jgi:hypothetical protein
MTEKAIITLHGLTVTCDVELLCELDEDTGEVRPIELLNIQPQPAEVHELDLSDRDFDALAGAWDEDDGDTEDEEDEEEDDELDEDEFDDED